MSYVMAHIMDHIMCIISYFAFNVTSCWLEIRVCTKQPWNDSSFLLSVWLSHFLSSIHSRWKSGDLNSSKLNLDEARFVLDRKPFASLSGCHHDSKNWLPRQKVVTFDPGLSFNFETETFLIRKCKDKWWNPHFSLKFLISYSFNWRCDQLTFLQTIDAR